VRRACCCFLGGLVSSVAAPAWACGLRAYIPDRAGASVVRERAMVAWDGKTQDILMSFNVSGSSTRPPGSCPCHPAAQGLARRHRGFEELGRLTAPRGGVPRLVVADVHLAAPERRQLPWRAQVHWRCRERARASADRPVRRHRLAAKRPDRVGYVAGGQGISGVRTALTRPCAVFRATSGRSLRYKLAPAQRMSR